MKSKGFYFELRKNYLRKLTSDRACHVFREERASLLTGQPEIQTPYSSMPQSLRVSTFSGLETEDSGTIQETGLIGGAQMGARIIQPIEGRGSNLVNPSVVSKKYRGLMQMIRDRIIDPLDEVLVKIHDFLKTIPEKLYDAELKLRDIFPLVLKGIILPAAVLLIFINPAFGADGTSADPGFFSHVTNLLENIFDIATNHWKAIALVGGNIWALSSLFIGKLPDYALGRVGSFLANFGRHIIFPLAMIGNMVFLGRNLYSTEYLNVREIFDNIGFAKLLWPSAGILSFFLGKTIFDYFKTRPNLDLDPHGTRLNHILTHLVYNFAMGTKTNYLVYRLLMTLLGAGILLASVGALFVAPSPPTFYIFLISIINLFFASWLLKSDLHMGIHSLVFMHQQKYSLIGERNPIISDRFMRKISGVFGPNTMLQKPHFFPREAAFAGFYTLMLNDYSENFELESETDLQPYATQKNKTELIAGYEVEAWKIDTQRCIRDFVLVPYRRLQRILNSQNATQDDILEAYSELIKGYETIADIYGDEGVDVAEWRHQNGLSDLPAAGALQDRLFAQAEGRVTLYGMLDGHIARDKKRKDAKKPTWFYNQEGDLVDPRFRNAVRKRLYRQSLKFRKKAAELRKKLEEAQSKQNYSKLSIREVRTLFREVISRFSKRGNYVARKEDKNDDKKAAKITNVAFCQTHAGDTLYRVFVYDPKRKFFYVEYVPSLFVRIPNPRYNYGVQESDGSVEPEYLWVDRTQLEDCLKFSYSGSNEIEYVDNSPPQDASSREVYIRVGWRRRKVKAYNLGDSETPNQSSVLIFREGKENSLDGSRVWIAGNSASDGLEDMIVVDEKQAGNSFKVPEGKISWFRKRPEVISFITPYSYLMNDSEHVDISTPTTSGAFLEKDSRVNKVLRIMFAYKRRKMHFDDPEPDRSAEEIKSITWVKSDMAFVFYEEIGTEEDVLQGRIKIRKGDHKQDGKVYRRREVPYDVMREGFTQVGLFGKKLNLDSKKVRHVEARIEGGKYVLYIHFKGKRDPVRVNMYGNTYARFLPPPDKILKLRRGDTGSTVEFLGFTERIGVISYICVDYGEGYKSDSERYRFVRMPGRLREFSSERIERIRKRGSQIFFDSSVQRPKILPWDDKWACAGEEGYDRLKVLEFNNGGKVWYGLDLAERVYKWAPTREEATAMGLRGIKEARGKDLIKVRYKDGSGQIKESVMPVGARFGKPAEIADILVDRGGHKLQGVKIGRQFLFGLREGEVLPPGIENNFDYIRYIKFKNLNGKLIVEVHFYKEGEEWQEDLDGDLFRGFNGIRFPELDEIYQFGGARAERESLKPEVDDETRQETGRQIIDENFEFTLHPQLFTYEGVVYIRFNTCKRTKETDIPQELSSLLGQQGIEIIDINYSIAESAVKVEDSTTGKTEWVPSVARIEDVDISHIPKNKILTISYFDEGATGPEKEHEPKKRKYRRVQIPKDARNVRIEKGALVYETGTGAVSTPLEEFGISNRAYVHRTFLKEISHGYIPMEAENIRVNTVAGTVDFTVNGQEESIPLSSFGIGKDGRVHLEFFINTIKHQVRKAIGSDIPFKIVDLALDGQGRITYKLVFDEKAVTEMDTMDKILARFSGKRPKWLKKVESKDGKVFYLCEEGLIDDWGLNVRGLATPSFMRRHFQLKEPRGKRRVAISVPIPVGAYDFKIVDGVITYKIGDETHEIGDAVSGNDFIPWESKTGSEVYQLKIAEHRESDIIHGYYSSTTGPQNTIGGDEQSNYDQRPFYTHDPSSGEAELDFFPFNEYYLDTPGGIIQIGKSGGQDKYGQPTSVTVNNGTPFFMKWSAVLEVGETELPLLEFPYKKKIVLFGTEMGEASIIEDFQQAHYSLIEWRRQNKFIPKPSSLAENQGGSGVVAKMAVQRQRWGASKEIGIDYILPDILEEVWRGKVLGSIPWIRKIWGQPSTMTWKEIIDHMMLITWYFVGPGELGRALSPAVTLLSNGEVKPYIADFEYFTATVALDVLGGMGGFAFSMYKGGYRPFYSLFKGPGRFSALMPAYYELFDTRYQGSAIGPFVVTATTYEGVKRSHRRMLGMVRGLNKLALLYVMYKYLRYETNVLSHIYSDEESKALLAAAGLGGPRGDINPDYLDNLFISDIPVDSPGDLRGVPEGYEGLREHGAEIITPVDPAGGQGLMPEDLGVMGGVVAPPQGYEHLRTHGTQIIDPPHHVSRSAEEGLGLLGGDTSGNLTYSTYGNAFWALYLLLITHFGVKWLRTVMGVPTNTYRPYEEEMETRNIPPIPPAQDQQKNDGSKEGKQTYNYEQLEEILRAKGVVDQAVEDTPSISDGFQDTRVEYSNTSSATDWKLYMEANKLLALGDIKFRILARAILRKLVRDSQDINLRHDARILLHQSRKAYPDIISGAEDSELIKEAKNKANGLAASSHFFVNLLYLEGFQAELRKPMEIWWHKLFKRGETSEFTLRQARSYRKKSCELARAVSDGIERKVNALASQQTDDIQKLRAMRDLLYRLRYSFSVSRFILRKLPRQRRVLNMTYRKPLKKLRGEILALIRSMRKRVHPVYGLPVERRLKILAEIYKAQALFNFRGIRSWWNIVTRLNILNPLWHTQNYRKKASILKEINSILNSLRLREEEIEIVLETTRLSDIERKALEEEQKRINKILEDYREFDIFDELMALQKDYINMLRFYIIGKRRKKSEKQKFRQLGQLVYKSSEGHIRDIHNSFERLISTYKKFKNQSYQFYLRSSDIFADIGWVSRWTVENYANHALLAIQRKRENTTDVIKRIITSLNKVGLTQVASSIENEITNINSQKPSSMARVRAIEKVIRGVSKAVLELLNEGKLDEASEVLREMALLNHPQIQGNEAIKKALDLYKAEGKDDLRTKLERHLQNNPINAELGILKDMTDEVSIGPAKRILMPRYKIDPRYIREVINNTSGRYNIEERRQLLQVMLKGYYPAGRRGLQRDIVRALVDIYNQKLAEANGNETALKAVYSEIEAFEGLFYEFYVLMNRFHVRDEERFRNNTGAYKFLWDLALFRKEKYIRRHGRVLKKAVNAVLLNPFSYATGYRIDIRFSPIEDVSQSPQKFHDKVDRVSNSMSWTDRAIYSACAKAQKELLSDLGYFSLDFSLK